MTVYTGSFDRILKEFVGGHGRYQLFITLVMTLIIHLGASCFSNVIFAAYEPKHRCRVPQCEIENQGKVSINFQIDRYVSNPFRIVC